jgi:DNA invertase Pin-like site-specific DNA recombinase
MTKRAYSYIRMSTDLQLRGDSLRRQMEASRRYADTHHLHLAEQDELRDIGISAFKGDNIADGALGGFLRAVRDRKVPPGSVLLVESLDRLSRQEVRRSLSLFLEVINAGIEVHTLTDGRVYTAEKTDVVDLVSSLVVLSRAHDESRTKSLRVASAWANKRKHAITSKLTARCPSWLKMSDDRKVFDAIPERADIVRTIFEEAAEGIGAYSITRRLNEARVPAFGKTNWHESYVNRILTNRAVLGEYQPCRMIDGRAVPDGEPIKNYFPRVIDDDLFFRAQAGRGQRRLRRGRRGEGVSNLFSGLLKCAYCGERMVFERKGQTYLTCYSAKRGLGCVGKRWRYDEFEMQFLSFVKEIDLASIIHSDDDAKKRAALEGIVTSLKGEVASIKSQMDKMIELLEVAGTATTYVAGKLQELENRKVTIESELHEREDELARGNAALNVQDIEHLADRITNTTGEDTYRLRSMIAARLRSIIDTILVAPAGDAPKTEKTVAFLREQPDTKIIIKELEKTIEKDRMRHFAVVFIDGKKRICYPWPFPKK